MRILLTVNFSPWSAYSGGGQRSAHELACALVQRGHAVTVVYTRPLWERFTVPDDLPYEIEWAGFFGLRSRSGAVLRSFNAFTVARAVRRWLDRVGPPSTTSADPSAKTSAHVSAGTRIDAIVHSQGEEGALLPRLRAGGHDFGFVATPRYPKYPSVDGWTKRWLLPPKFRALGAALRGADRYCPTSEASAIEVRATYEFDDARCTVVPNGLADAFVHVERDADAPRGPILFWGRLSPTKGGHVLVEALAALGADAPPLVVCGRGPDENRLRAMTERLGVRAQFVGWQTPAQLADRLAGARLAVLPSREESFGNAMAEAMAAGTPLVTTRVGSLPELVPEGVGVLVPPDDPKALTDALRSLLADEARCEAMGLAGLERARTRYSWDATAAAFEQVYREVLDGADPGAGSDTRA